MVWDDRVWSDIADRTVNHQAWWLTFRNDHTQLTNCCTFKPLFEFRETPRYMCYEPSIQLFLNEFCNYGFCMNQCNPKALLDLSQPLVWRPRWRWNEVRVHTQRDPLTKLRRKSASGSPSLKTAKRCQRWSRKGWPGGVSSKWSPGGHPRHSRRSSTYGCERGGSLQPEIRAAVILRQCLVSLNFLNHLDLSFSNGSAVHWVIWKAVLGRLHHLQHGLCGLATGGVEAATATIA